MTKKLAVLAILAASLLSILSRSAVSEPPQAGKGPADTLQGATPSPTSQLSQKPGKVYHVGGDVKPPRLMSSSQPVLSEEQLKQLGAGKKPAKTGTAIVAIVVGPDGTVRNAKVVQSFDRRLNTNAIEAVEQWKFEPATKKGVPVAVELAVEVEFNLYR